MRENIKLLLIYVAIGVIAAGTTAYFLYQDRKELWREYARSTFAEVLREDLLNRSGKEMFYTSWGNANSFAQENSVNNDSLQEVEVTSEHGSKKYLIPIYKLAHNIENENFKRGIQGYVLEKEPLVADSLHTKWVKLLQEMSFSGKSIVRVSVTDLLEHETRKYSNDSAYLNQADSLDSYYIGYRSEIEVTGFLYSQWWQLFFVKDMVLLCGIVMFCFLFPLIEKYIRRLYHRYFCKTIVATGEKVIPVITAEKDETFIYELDKGVFFDANTRTLSKGNSLVIMTPQTAILLKEFLDVQHHELSVEEIMKKMWGVKERNKEKVYITIKRLRDDLYEISACTIINVGSAYQLIIPISSKKIFNDIFVIVTCKYLTKAYKYVCKTL